MHRLQAIELIQQHHPVMGESEIVSHINRVQQDFTMKTGCNRYLQDVGDTVAGQRYYPSIATTILITKVYRLWVDDVLLPRLVTRDAAMLIDDDEHENPDNALSTPTTESLDRYWYPQTKDYTASNKRYQYLAVGIVEKSTDATKRHGKVSDFQTITKSGLQIRLDYEGMPADVIVNAGKNDLGGNIGVPPQFAIAIVNKVIATGYRDPRNQKPQMAQYFEETYNEEVKQAKKWVRRNYIGTGHIVPCDF